MTNNRILLLSVCDTNLFTPKHMIKLSLLLTFSSIPTIPNIYYPLSPILTTAYGHIYVTQTPLSPCYFNYFTYNRPISLTLKFYSRESIVKNYIIIFIISLISFQSVKAGIAGSDHDLTASGHRLCMMCHLPHNAQGEKLWVSTPDGTFSGVAALCFTCHDGSVTTTGITTVFDQDKEQHVMVGADCSAADGCHDVHNQNINKSGQFVVVDKTYQSYCATCHGATLFPGAEGLGDHTAGITHFRNPPPFDCEQCHTVHGATAQTVNPAGITNPILLADNHSGDYYGTFCISCHNGIVPTTAVQNTGERAANDIFDYAEATNDGSETQHPTISTGGAFPVGGCDKCHDVHDPTGTDYGYILIENNSNSSYCIACHNGTDAPAVGGNTHYTGIPLDITMNVGLTPAIPWANQINEDGFPGADWSSATANLMVCETCHSVHRAGWTSTGSGFFLRHANGTLNTICSRCHVDN